VAREVATRGGRVVAVSTVEGSVADPAGLDVDGLLELRRMYGDDFVAHCGLPMAEPARLFAAAADVIPFATLPFA
jgi:glutamate dehydrogenase/leucine dehydrogenase